jgi:hypothetical protein
LQGTLLTYIPGSLRLPTSSPKPTSRIPRNEDAQAKRWKLLPLIFLASEGQLRAPPSLAGRDMEEAREEVRSEAGSLAALAA